VNIEDDDAALRRYGSALVDAIGVALEGWIRRCVAAHVVIDDGLDVQVRAVAARAAAEVIPVLRELVLTDAAEQRVNPMAVLRAAVRYPTEVLASHGVAQVARDEFAQRNFPDDPYDLTPASFADVDPSLAEPGIVWGAAKAHVLLQRRARG
jgi:hypothetical protein